MIHEKLNSIQTRLAAPKGQRNTFGNYNYRSCEDILNALKPLLSETGCTVTLSDEIVAVAGRVYVCATASIQHGSETVTVKAWAREPDSRKGMDEAQVTGATSSYARKYALNGLFAIDDTKDADTQPPQPNAPTISERVYKAIAAFNNCSDAAKVMQVAAKSEQLAKECDAEHREKLDAAYAAAMARVNG